MKAFTITGGIRDQIYLQADTAEECVQLVRINQSHFIGQNKTYLDLSNDKTIGLRIWMSEPRPAGLSQQTREAIDQTT